MEAIVGEIALEHALLVDERLVVVEIDEATGFGEGLDPGVEVENFFRRSSDGSTEARIGLLVMIADGQ